MKQAKGNYLFFLAPDTELIGADSLEEMLGSCMRKESGIVGARLYDGENRIAHAGVIIGLHGLAGAAFARLSKDGGRCLQPDLKPSVLQRSDWSLYAGETECL